MASRFFDRDLKSLTAVLLLAKYKQLTNPSRSEKIGKNAAAYAAERLMIQKTFFKLKICGL
jgi:hypothetical protein